MSHLLFTFTLKCSTNWSFGSCFLLKWLNLIITHHYILDVPLVSTRINVSVTASDLGVVINSQLWLSAQVAAVCCSSYYHLQQLRPLVRSMSVEAVKTLVQVFISCRLSQLTVLWHCRRSHEPAAVCPECGCTFGVSWLNDRITPVLQELHWLPVRHRVDFNTTTLVYLTLSSMAPTYLAINCQLVSRKVVVSCVLHINNMCC